MQTRNSVCRRRRRASFGVVLCGGLGLLAASCGDTQPCGPGVSSKLISSKLTQSSVTRVDLVVAIDNSRSMADKQQILALAVPDLVRDIVNPACVSEATGDVSSQPASPLDACPQGSVRKHDPIFDLHVGVISSSLGGHGSDACGANVAGKASNNDQGHLLDRKDPATAETIPTYQNLKFLAWDPEQKLSPPGEADLDADSAIDANMTALVPQLRELVLGVGQIGCGYEAQLESWYRFLVDPSPYESITIDADQSVVLNGVDKVLLDQRKQFLRPDSLLAIMMLSDENDCSIRESGQFYLAAQQKTPNGAPFHLPRARAVCDQDPNNECCFSCGQTGPTDANGNPTCDDDPSCKTADGKVATLDETSDNINLRCWNQKRRFGIDFLYPIDRYVTALTDAAIPDRNGAIVPNPIFSDLDPTDTIANVRSPNLVTLTAITGVPWQDIARTNAQGQPDLKAGLDPAGRASGGFKSATELAMTLPGKDFNTWDVILGDPENYPAESALPRDPLMIESVDPRTGTNPITGEATAPPSSPLANKINGNEWTIPKRDDLQYACILPLVQVDLDTGAISPAVRDCSTPGAYAGCDCEDKTNDNPLCQASASGERTDQVRAKAYPGVRELAVVRKLGAQGIVASACPAQLNAIDQADFGYRPVVAAVTDRLQSLVAGQCFGEVLTPDESGQVECLLIEAQRVGADAATCGQCAGAGRSVVSSDHQGAVDQIKNDNSAASFDCFCEITQLVGAELDACQDDPSKNLVNASGEAISGYCYVDPQNGVGNPEIVAACPSSDQRLMRFVGAGNPVSGSTVFLTCVAESSTGSGCSE